MSDEMNKIIATGIIKPGQQYILLRERDDSFDLPFLHVIEEAEGLIIAIRLAIYVIYGKKAKLHRIIGVNRDVEDRHFIRLSCDNIGGI